MSVNVCGPHRSYCIWTAVLICIDGVDSGPGTVGHPVGRHNTVTQGWHLSNKAKGPMFISIVCNIISYSASIIQIEIKNWAEPKEKLRKPLWILQLKKARHSGCISGNFLAICRLPLTAVVWHWGKGHEKLLLRHRPGKKRVKNYCWRLRKCGSTVKPRSGISNVAHN